jgi:hypothetical protein
VALPNIALAPAVAVGVDGKAECVITVVDGASDMVINPIGIATNVKLENLKGIA